MTDDRDIFTKVRDHLAQEYREKNGHDASPEELEEATEAFALLAEFQAEAELDCDHEFTHSEPRDDTRYFDCNGNLQERSNPDAEVCDICGEVLN